VKGQAWLEVAADMECNGELNYNYTLYVCGYDFYGTVEQSTKFTYY